MTDPAPPLVAATSEHRGALSGFVPCLDVVGANFLVDEGTSIRADYHESRRTALRLSFAYGDVVVPASDPGSQVFVGGRASARVVKRDLAGEAGAKRILESHGPVDVHVLDDFLLVPGQEADYLADVDGDADAICHFLVHVVPALERAGWRVRIDPSCPFRLVSPARWFTRLRSADDAPGWFEVELGVEVDGSRVDLMPVLLELLTENGSRIDRLSTSHRPFMAIPIGRGRHVAVPPERVCQALEVLRELHECEGPPTSGCKIPELVPYYLDELERCFVVSDGREWGPQRGKLDALSSAGERRLVAVDPPRHLIAELRPYQLTGLAWLQQLAAHDMGGILADDMGLGKTLQTIAHVCMEQQMGRLDLPALIVTPTSVVENWRRELRRFAPDLQTIVLHGPDRHVHYALIRRAQVVLTSYPILIRDLELYARERFHLVVLDEAQAIKNARSQAHHAARSLVARLRLCLTGTPIENNLEELRALFEFLQPRLLGDAASFRARFRVPIEQMADEERLASLRRRVAPFLLRRLKLDVAADLPAKTEILHSIEIEGPQRDLYEAIRVAAHATIRRVIREKGLAGSTVDVLAALMRLRQVCCDPRLVPMEGANRVARSAKLEELMEMVPRLVGQGRRILIFSQFTSMLALVSQAMRARRVNHLCLTGATPNRQQLVDRFEAGAVDVFLISLKAGGAGLNLTSADTVIHYDPWWNPASQNQATDRAHRIGQTRPVFVYQLIVSGSVEEKMLELQQRKRELADGILAGALTTGLDEHEVDALLAPLPR